MSAKQVPRLVLKSVVQNGQRFYAVEGKSVTVPRMVPSVTTILSSAVNKPGLASWQKKQSVEYFKKKLLTMSPIKSSIFLPSNRSHIFRIF
jgi:hypothetical protein